MKQFLALAVIVIVAGLSCMSCKRNRDIVPSSEYAPYVSAYTGGVISSDASIFIELTEEQQIVEIGAEVKEKLFRFSPSLKGKTFWVNNKMLQFIPDSGALKPGELYNATFALGKVMKVEKKLEEFEFSFRVEERSFVMEFTSLDVVESAMSQVAVQGEIRFSEAPPATIVQDMITAMRENESFSAVVTPTDNPRTFHFVIPNIAKKEAETTLEVTVDGKAFNSDKRIKQEMDIPALTPPFELLSAKVIEAPEHGMCLTFSSPVSNTQDLNGLITLEPISAYTFQVEDNKVKIFFERKSENTSLYINVDQGLKNVSDESLPRSSSVTLQMNSLSPQVEFLSSGTIMPDSKELVLPFRAVNLYAVDLKVIRIFESNVLMFLQDNSLSASSSSELRRSGRLIYKKMLRLDSDPTKNIHDWDNYFIDLSGVMKQEPGAIYRVELSFKQDYSAYPCGNEPAARNLQASNALTRIEAGEMTEEDEAVWDQPQTYYYDNSNIDWDIYEWDERDNPCHPSYYMVSERKATTNVMASNMGVIVKGNTNNTLWVTVSNLLDTKPMSNVEVTAYNFQLQPIGKARTDGDGFALIKAKNKPFVLVALSEDKQKTYLRLVDGEDNLLSRFDVGGKEIKKGLRGFVYGERGVWRPGDTLHLSFMLEDREKRIPVNHPVSIEVYNPRGQFYQKQVSSKGLNGLYTFTVPTKADDPTGLWNAYVKVGGTSFHKSLRIETVKPNRLKINLTIPGKQLKASASPVQTTLESAWLTGAVAQHLKTKVELLLSETTTQFKGYEKYIFHNPAADFTSSTIDLYSGVLDGEGKSVFRMSLPAAKNAPGMLRANITCRVFEPGGDASIYTQTIPFSPFDSYVGIRFGEKDKTDFLETDVDHRFEVVTLSPDGQPTNRSGLEYKIYKIGWSWWWEHDDESFVSYLNNSSISPVASGTLSTSGGKARIGFRVDYPQWGRYLVYVKDRESGHATGGVIYIDWPSWRGRSNKSDPNGIKMLAFSLDKSSYEAGQNATVIIPSSAGGRALVSIENGSEVISREWVDMASSGDTKYTFKITEQMAPNVYVHVSLLQPHAQTVNDLPIRMYGVVPVFVTNKGSELTPQITMPDVLRPETEFTVKVKETSGKAMTYTLAVVDDGLLDLTNFKTPDPWNVFYAREALGIRTWDMYDFVMGAYAGKYGSLFSIGGDEDMKPANSKANRFKPVVKFIGPFALKKGEEQSHKLKLPPYIGSVRVMVVAGQDGAYGKAEKTVPVRTPLMILSSLPRVVSTDEEIYLPVNVFAMENTVKNVSIKVETTGKLKIANGGSQSLTFAAPGDKMVYFALKSGSSTGIERVTVTATGNGHTSKETIEIDVRNPNPPIIRTDNKLLNAGESADFTYTLDGDFDGNWVKLEVSRIPSVDISRRFDYLYDYPHYCSEQLTSRALPLLFIAQFKDMEEKETESVKKNVREAILNLYGRQLSNGGITYWPGDGYENEWVTSYAGSFLVLAKEKGYDVNSGVLSRWKNYQRSAAQNWRANARGSRRYAYYQSDFSQAYRLYTLALSGAPELGAMNRMKELKDLSMQARWCLAAAYALSGKTKAASELVFNASTEVAPYALNNSTFGSSERDMAMILEAMVLMGKEKEAFEQARKVSANLSREQSFTTQSTAYSLVAMGRLAEKVSGSLQFDWTSNGKAQSKVNSARAVFQKDLPTRPTNGAATVKNNGNGLLYVSLVSKTKPLRDSLPSIEQNLRMTVTYTDLKGTLVDVQRLKQGTDFMAVIRVSNISGINDYTDVALTQLIPSGWEVYNERMLNPDDPDTEKAASYIYRDIRDDGVMTYFDLKMGETKVFKVRLQASYAGTFVLPAVHCGAMYDAGAQARTRAGRVTVER